MTLDIWYYDKGLKRASTRRLPQIKNKFLWIDVNKIEQHEAQLLAGEFGLHPVTVNDLIHSNVRIKVEEFSNYLLFVFYGIVNGKKLESQELDFVLGKNFLITNHAGRSVSCRELKANRHHLELLFQKGVDFIFHHLLDTELAHFGPVVHKIDDEIQLIEAKIARKPLQEHYTRMLRLKNTLTKIKRIAMTHREKLMHLTKDELGILHPRVLPYLRDTYDQSIRIADEIESTREEVNSASELFMSTMSNQMSETMKILSVFATITLPLTVISSIYGTNFDFMPGIHHQYGFWIMVGFMIVFSGSIIYTFKRRNWF